MIVSTPARIGFLTNIEPQMTMRYSVIMTAARRSFLAFTTGVRPFNGNRESRTYQWRQAFRKRGQA
jgi:hypothetical protein